MMTNVDRIAELRGISLVEAIDFYKQVSAAAGTDLSTYEVLKAVQGQGECAASISPEQLAESRKALEAKRMKKRQEEFEAAEVARLKKLAEQRAAQQRSIAATHKALAKGKTVEEKAEEEEFRMLVAEMSTHNFTHTREISAHIVRNNLGNKYKHISGRLKMKMDGDVWDFEGGFPPKIYARLCEELGLRNQGSRAVAQEFTPYKDISGH